MNARPHLTGVPKAIAASVRVDIGHAPLENAERAAYQSARTKDGKLAPLPLTLAEALAEAESLRPGLFPIGEP